MSQLLHITNGDDITTNLQEVGITGDVVVWREMLCEGPTVLELESD
ncbi:hypothetical protein LZ575_02610 [Antarcticibacterium sp. 1MA-6-2]|nr:hypothetical protein [Antarcticibacterium sp. 1MA-6-2]UJH91615.1 hypothetical protein LZ575_02610 [Antarcticibacterium sp. 1MA-6-2]